MNLPLNNVDESYINNILFLIFSLPFSYILSHGNYFTNTKLKAMLMSIVHSINKDNITDLPKVFQEHVGNLVELNQKELRVKFAEERSIAMNRVMFNIQHIALSFINRLTNSKSEDPAILIRFMSSKNELETVLDKLSNYNKLPRQQRHIPSLNSVWCIFNTFYITLVNSVSDCDIEVEPVKKELVKLLKNIDAVFRESQSDIPFTSNTCHIEIYSIIDYFAKFPWMELDLENPSHNQKLDTCEMVMKKLTAIITKFRNSKVLNVDSVKCIPNHYTKLLLEILYGDNPEQTLKSNGVSINLFINLTQGMNKYDPEVQKIDDLRRHIVQILKDIYYIIDDVNKFYHVNVTSIFVDKLDTIHDKLNMLEAEFEKHRKVETTPTPAEAYELETAWVQDKKDLPLLSILDYGLTDHNYPLPQTMSKYSNNGCFSWASNLGNTLSDSEEWDPLPEDIKLMIRSIQNKLSVPADTNNKKNKTLLTQNNRLLSKIVLALWQRGMCGAWPTTHQLVIFGSVDGKIVDLMKLIDTCPPNETIKTYKSILKYFSATCKPMDALYELLPRVEQLRLQIEDEKRKRNILYKEMDNKFIDYINSINENDDLKEDEINVAQAVVRVNSLLNEFNTVLSKLEAYAAFLKQSVDKAKKTKNNCTLVNAIIRHANNYVKLNNEMNYLMNKLNLETVCDTCHMSPNLDCTNCIRIKKSNRLPLLDQILKFRAALYKIKEEHNIAKIKFKKNKIKLLNLSKKCKLCNYCKNNNNNANFINVNVNCKKCPSSNNLKIFHELWCMLYSENGTLKHMDLDNNMKNVNEKLDAAKKALKSISYFSKIKKCELHGEKAMLAMLQDLVQWFPDKLLKARNKCIYDFHNVHKIIPLLFPKSDIRSYCADSTAEGKKQSSVSYLSGHCKVTHGWKVILNMLDSFSDVEIEKICDRVYKTR